MTTATYLLTFPSDGGTNGQYLTTNGLDTLSWTSASTRVSLQTVFSYTGAVATGTNSIPIDNTIPQNTEGTEYMTLSITPLSSSNLLKITAIFYFSAGSSSASVGALFQDSTANALASGPVLFGPVNTMRHGYFTHSMVAGTTSSTTFKIRIGGGGTVSFNGSGGSRVFGGVSNSGMIIREFAP